MHEAPTYPSLPATLNPLDTTAFRSALPRCGIKSATISAQSAALRKAYTQCGTGRGTEAEAERGAAGGRLQVPVSQVYSGECTLYVWYIYIYFDLNRNC